jgi:tetratricopeptide (TPR) repeat protein
MRVSCHILFSTGASASEMTQLWRNRMPSETRRARKVLIISINAPEDEELRKLLDRHMSILKHSGLIEGWSKENIPVGSDARSALAQHLNNADIILLLISVDFVNSDDCYHAEMMPALARHNAHEALVIPILLRPTDWRGLPLADLQWLPRFAKAVTLWRSKDEAFSHIVESIRKIIQDGEQALVATSDPLPPFWFMPHRRNLLFSARQNDLDELHNRFTKDRDDPLTVQAITGLPGQGKTELALEYAFRYRKEYTAVFWLRCDSRRELFADFLQIADLLRLSVESFTEEQEVIKKVKHCLTHFSERWFIIFDNAFDVSMLDDFIPTGGNGDVLITTTDQTIGTLAHALALVGMNEDDGANFLLKRAKIKQPDSDHIIKAKEMSKLLDGLPLALDQAGAYIEKTRKSLSEYIQNYCVHLDARGHNPQRRSPKTVMATFSLCFEQIKQRNLTALDILHLCAFLNAEAIPERLFVVRIPEVGSLLQSLSDDQLEEALEDLQRYSLISRDDGAFRIHRLVQIALKNEMKEDEKRQWEKRVVYAVNAIFPDVQFAVWSACQEYLPHVQVCAELMHHHHEVESPEGARLLDRAGYYLYERSQYGAAQSFFEQAVEIQQRVLRSHHPDTAHVLTHLGALSRSLGQYSQAEKYYHDARAVLEQEGHDQAPLALARIFDGQGELAQTQHFYSRAQQLYEQALEIRQRTLLLEDPDVAVSLANLAGISEEQGNFSQAKLLYEQAVAIYEKVVVPDHPAVALVLSNFARFCGDQKEYAQAERLFERAKAIRERVFGTDHPKVAGTLHNLASLSLESGDPSKYVAAERSLRHALKIWEQAYGTSAHPNSAASLRILAKLYQKQQLYSKAETLYKQALTIYTHVSGPESLDLAHVFCDLGELYSDQNENDQAVIFLKRALAISQKRQGTEHPDSLALLNRITRLSGEQSTQ